MATKVKNEGLQVVDYRYDEGFRGRVEYDIVSTITTKSSGYSGMPLIMKTMGGELYEKIKNKKINTERVYATYGLCR